MKNKLNRIWLFLNIVWRPDPFEKDDIALDVKTAWYISGEVWGEE